MFIRKHHCRKCGAVVCSEHFQNKQVLPSKSTPQNVCDNCFFGKAPVRRKSAADIASATEKMALVSDVPRKCLLLKVS